MKSSRKRSIITPRPTTTALIQATFNESHPHSSRRTKFRSKNVFSGALLEQIDEKITRCQNDSEKHQIYREAFSSIINKYSDYSDSMNIIKKGYEELIDQISNEIEYDEQVSVKISKSRSDFMNLLELQKSDMDEKKVNYLNLSKQTEEQIELLTHEIRELSIKVSENQEALKDEDYFLRQKYAALSEYQEKCQKKESKFNKVNHNYEQLKETKTNLKTSIENHQIIISKTLDEIFNKNRTIKNTKQSISSIEKEISKETLVAEKKREKLKQLEEANKSLTESISNYNNEISKINKENDDITNYLLEAMNIDENKDHEIKDPIHLTERFVTVLTGKRTFVDIAT